MIPYALPLHKTNKINIVRFAKPTPLGIINLAKNANTNPFGAQLSRSLDQITNALPNHVITDEYHSQRSLPIRWWPVRRGRRQQCGIDPIGHDGNLTRG